MRKNLWGGEITKKVLALCDLLAGGPAQNPHPEALMLAQRSWWLALSAAILMLTPFLWLCCCPLTAGIGIWALVILARPDVRAPMRGRVDSAPPPAFPVPPPPPPEKPPHGGGWGSGA